MSSYIKSFEIPPDRQKEVVLASGGVNPELAETVASSLGVELTEVTRKRHGNGERYVRFDESVRGKDVFIIQSHATIERDDPNKTYTIEEALNEHLYMVSAAAGSSARSVMAIAPYLIHSRGDRKSKGREVVPGPLVIQFFEVAGMKTRFGMMSIDPHSQQTPEHLRSGPYDSLTAQPELRRAVVEDIGLAAMHNSVIVAPDAGAMKRSVRHAREITKLLRLRTENPEINIRALFMDKQRGNVDTSVIERGQEFTGVEGKICVSFDDLIGTGNTAATEAKDLKNAGAAAIYLAATHATFTPETVETLMNSEINKVILSDTLPIEEVVKEMGDRLIVVKTGQLIGRGIYENVVGGSITKMFDDQNHL
jgi:ribose-phosphate pyrophosphokinase